MFLRFTVAAALLTVASVSSANPAEPPPNGRCLCQSGAEQLLEQIDHVFIGDLVEVKGIDEEVGTAVIRVRENFKGDLSGVVKVRDAASMKRIAEQNPMRVLVEPQDTAEAAVFLASPEARYITGENLKVNAGNLM